MAWESAILKLTWAVGVDGGVSESPEPMALRNRIMCRHKSHLPCSRAVLNRRVACCLLTAGTSIFYQKTKTNKKIWGRQAFFIYCKCVGRHKQSFIIPSLHLEKKHSTTLFSRKTTKYSTRKSRDDILMM